MELQLNKEQIRELFLDAEKNCSLCGSELRTEHHTDHISQKVTEQSICKSCGIRTKKRSFILQ